MNQVIGDPIQGVKTNGALRETCEYATFTPQIEPKSFKEAEHDESWINAMQEELGQSTIQSLVQNG